MPLTAIRTTTSWAARRTPSRHTAYTRIRLLRRPIESRRLFSTSPALEAALQDAKVNLKHVRNIGIIAHIDAGKTTTTERMLFYSGTTNRIGDVDEGSTVMDYLPEEKQRGITITSAAITLEWPPSPPHNTTQDILSKPIHTINLIDTPGHADFTFEVERSIRVLDGAVTILDGVAGVEAQTETVWRQADRYRIPKIIYVNKMDREGAVFGRVVKDIAGRLNIWPAVTQIPVTQFVKRENGVRDETFGGVVDLVHMNIINWKAESEGRDMTLKKLEDVKDKYPDVYTEAVKARIALVEVLAEWDEAILTKFVETEDHNEITPADLKRALRFCTLNPHTRVIPVLMGASRANMGVQPVLDAVLDYLPDPMECDKNKIPVTVRGERALLDVREDSKVCALVFKVMHDPKRGMLSYVRVYSGTLRHGDTLFNTTLQSRERALKLLRMYANEATDISMIRTGHIGVIVNYKNSRTGDTLINADSVQNLQSSGVTNYKHQKREKKFRKKHEKDNGKIDVLTDATLQLRPIDVPPPVFFASLEPNSTSDEKGMQDALSIIEREDPSLHISTDDESGQMVLSGMGELHLEISRNRLVSDLKAKCTMGHIRIGYREVVIGSTTVREVYEREILGKKSYAGVTATIEALPSHEGGEPLQDPLGVLAKTTVGGNEIIIAVNTTQELEDPTVKIPGYIDTEALLDSLTNGAIAALSRGPMNYEMHSTQVVLTLDPTDFKSSVESTPNAFLVAARMAVEKAISSCGTGLMEPFMNVVISCEEGDVGNVVADITSGAGGGSVLALDDEGEVSVATSGGSGSSAYNTSTSSSSSEVVDLEPIDVSRVYAPPQSYKQKNVGGDEFEGSHVRTKLVRCRVPLAKMTGYVKHLKSMTKGRGTFVMSMDRFERMSDVRVRNAMAGRN
ncbi:hypothetical protein H072_1431 [Dactylellina haptotyla CBS 200.50]|uniref:Elongation factor 2 n=1 Tax=Dactylellina haptotyla (strain CBS 200.50) TaxID=1284197 RepID=S8BYL3_DACHA|nr:hypothetical protein H072_1431 [Dactylellina haptotyla CBS 200.50]